MNFKKTTYIKNIYIYIAQYLFIFLYQPSNVWFQNQNIYIYIYIFLRKKIKKKVEELQNPSFANIRSL